MIKAYANGGRGARQGAAMQNLINNTPVQRGAGPARG